jgi:hypothetical protein
MIKEKLNLLSSELKTKFTVSVDDHGNMVNLKISEDQDGMLIPKFTILVDEEDSDEKYVLSVLESPLTIYFGSNLCETTKFFVSPDIEEIFDHMKEEIKLENSRGY